MPLLALVEIGNVDLHQVFRPRTAAEAIDLVSKLLEYTPDVRLSAVEAMVQPFFDELRAEGAKMPNGKEFRRYSTLRGKVRGQAVTIGLLS